MEMEMELVDKAEQRHKETELANRTGQTTNDDGDGRTMNSEAARERPERQPNSDWSGWNRRTIAGMVGQQPERPDSDWIGRIS